MDNNQFNLISAMEVVKNGWRTIFLYVLLAVAAASISVFVVKPSFKSSALIISANTVLADKGRLFNTELQSLYSYFGSGDDLDRIYGMADMDITYQRLVEDFSLISYYEIGQDSLPIQMRKAIKYLRKDLQLQKTEQGQLRIVCWTNDKMLSANIVNRLTDILKETAMAIWQKNYRLAYDQMNLSISKMEKNYQLLSDSVARISGAEQELAKASKEVLLEQIKAYRKTTDEFKLAAESTPEALFVMESAIPAAKAERPDKLAIILGAALIGFIFSALLLLVYHRKTLV